MIEKDFLSALEEEDETCEITIEAYEEHRRVKKLLSGLESKNTEEWTAKLTVLKENIEHHVEEHSEMFKKAQQALSEEELGKLGDPTSRS